MENLKNQSTEKGRIEMEKVLDAPVQKVWEAFTDREKMKQWYFDIADFKPVLGQEFSFDGGDPNDKIFTHLCKIVELVPGKKIAHTWSYKGYAGESVLHIELKSEGNSTRLFLVHEGLHTFPHEQSFAQSNFEAGWSDIIGRGLPEFLHTEAAK